jgi:hypothetical protein
MKSFKIYMIGLILSFVACKEAYNPKATSFNNNFLVVDGFINTGGDSTIIKLSRTVTLANKKTINPETGATISVETSSGEGISLFEKEKGVYYIPYLSFGLNKKYRLKIKTKSGGNYLSDFVEPTVSPQIDSVNYQIKPNGLQLYVNTGDANNKTHYYRWEYEESWIFYAMYSSGYIWRNGPKTEERKPNEFIYQCWGNSNSSPILTGSTVKLDKDVIYLSPLTLVPSNSEKLTEKYSILVKQYALTKEAYDFWEILKKNTESLGSIFDVLPSELTGNIHSVNNTAEPVIGYISAGSMQQQRIFITKDKLPKWRPLYPYACSEPDTVLLGIENVVFGGGAKIPLNEVYNEIGILSGHTSAPRVCADCTIRGTTKRPIFWQ